MKTQITILCDNYAGAPFLIGEHGFSALIEQDNKRFLFDTGSGVGLESNLKHVGKNLKGVSRIFLSHGHYDHTGGLAWAVKETGPVNITAHPDIFALHMIKNPKIADGKPLYIGSPVSRKELEALGATFTWVDHTTKVEDGLWFITGVPCKPEQTLADPQLVVMRGDEAVQDMINDDASLLIETDTDPVLLLGCAHAGVMNILDHLRESMKIQKLRAILGGTHLMFFFPEMTLPVIERIEEFGVSQIAVSHCTGIRSAITLAGHFKDRFTTAVTGSVFSF